MDKLKAKSLETALLNLNIAGFKIDSLINNGKSAAVFKAKKGNKTYAMKIFDNEIVEKFGHEIQIKRILQEITLKNHTIPNLVKIFDGGTSILNDQTYYYIIMEYIKGENLYDFISSNDYSIKFVLKVLETLHRTTEQLLIEKGIAHRDIKPENIMVTNKGDIIIMDLGVLKLIGAKSFSDEEEKSFIGTLRYAAPEFLMRLEKDTLDGWRSLNYYQIGATLHDLIMKRELFIDRTPYTNLVIAIKEDIPSITNMKFPFELLQLTRDMLVKDWKLRLKLITNDRILNVIKDPKIETDSLEESLEELKKMRFVNTAQFNEIENINRTNAERQIRREEIGKSIASLIMKCIASMKTKNIIDNYSLSNIFHFSGDSGNDYGVQNLIYYVGGSLAMGFPQKLAILVRFLNNENSFAEIDAVGFYPKYNSSSLVTDPKLLILRNLSPATPLSAQINRVGPREILYNFKTIKLFSGVIEIDEALEKELTFKIAKIIFKAIKLAESNVQEQIQAQKIMAENDSLQVGVSELPQIIIDSLD